MDSQRAGGHAGYVERGRLSTPGLLAGPLLALAVYLLLEHGHTDLSLSGRKTAAVAVLLAIYWTTEALPLPVTSLLPLVLFPLAGVLSTADAAAPYANPFIFLYLGGFIIALAIERWSLHRRIALMTVLAVGTRPAGMIAGFMLATAALSMWISNTATTVMMLPIGMSVVSLVRDMAPAKPVDTNSLGVSTDRRAADNFGTSMMLGIAYAASIGGLATLVGTPPNVFFAAFVSDEFSITIGFGQWMLFAMPLAAIMLGLSWFVLTQILFPTGEGEITSGRELIHTELRRLGRVSRGEWTVLVVFVLTANLWIFRVALTKWGALVSRVPLVTRLDDTIIAVVAAASLFAIPVDLRRRVFAMDWEATGRLPWGVLLLFGGGLSLAEAVSNSGLDQWIGISLGRFQGLPVWGLIAVVTTVVIFLTELTSNVATAATLLPVLAGVAEGLAVPPLLLLVPAVLAASCAFMLPVATPPNAIVFGSGQVRVGQMAKAGFWLNLTGIVVIPVMIYLFGRWLV